MTVAYTGYLLYLWVKTPRFGIRALPPEARGYSCLYHVSWMWASSWEAVSVPCYQMEKLQKRAAYLPALSEGGEWGEICMSKMFQGMLILQVHDYIVKITAVDNKHLKLSYLKHTSHPQ